MPAAHLYQELQSVVLSLQVFQFYARRLALWVLHVVHIKLGKVAGNNPSWPFRVRQHGTVALRLLKGCEHVAVALLDGLPQVLAQRLLLYHDMRGGYHGIDERCVVQPRLLLKANEIGCIANAIDIGEQVNPKQLALALLISPTLPSFYKIGSRRALLFLCKHIFSLIDDDKDTTFFR